MRLNLVPRLQLQDGQADLAGVRPIPKDTICCNSPEKISLLELGARTLRQPASISILIIVGVSSCFSFRRSAVLAKEHCHGGGEYLCCLILYDGWHPLCFWRWQPGASSPICSGCRCGSGQLHRHGAQPPRPELERPLGFGDSLFTTRFNVTWR
jgi:hypothetical protein